MPKAPAGEWITLTIKRSWPSINATGATSLVLDTAEMGPIAIRVNREIVGILRNELAKIEAMLEQPQGNA